MTTTFRRDNFLNIAVTPLLGRIYPSYFKLHVRWLRSLARITYVSKLIRIPSLAACLKLELFRVYTRHLKL
ncbi:hypothetical protein BVY05_12735 [Pectobacterium odoriferum]|nr:hypothetical protein BV925_20900 [Pectobacterium odoriferum]POE00747.1 hypothetical protein BVY05_12735 [Pectobacterium odoriferum]